MDWVTHALVGAAIAGPPGAAVALVADAPLALADAWQVARGDLAPLDLLGPYRPPARGAVRRLLLAARVLHSAWTLPLLLAGPLGVAYVSHVLLDLLTHDETPVLPGVVPWSVCSSHRWRITVHVLWLWSALALVILWRSHAT